MATNFSKTAISTQGQKTGDLYVDEYCRAHDIRRPPFHKMFNDQDMLQNYIIGMTVGAINEYHQQLRIYFNEQGISVPDFMENILIDTEN